jgi:hypothetical protein
MSREQRRYIERPTQIRLRTTWPLVKEVTEDAPDFFADVAVDALGASAPSETPDDCFLMPWMSSGMTLPIFSREIQKDMSPGSALKLTRQRREPFYSHHYSVTPSGDSAGRRPNGVTITSLCSLTTKSYHSVQWR